jgi:hypothetical protein
MGLYHRAESTDRDITIEAFRSDPPAELVHERHGIDRLVPPLTDPRPVQSPFS